MTHNGRCANAKRHICKCTGCGGRLHGWPSRVELAKDESDAGREALRARADQVWAETGKRKRNAQPSLRRKAAGTDTAVADIVDWLADNPSAINDVQKLGNALAEQVGKEVDESPDGVDPRDRRRATTDHFWCDLLAALAWAISEFKRLPDKAADQITSIIFDERKREGRSLVERATTRLAVQAASKAIGVLFPPIPINLDNTLRAVRILAILICPAPEHHPAVAHNCVEPLINDAKSIISADTKKRLMEVFPADWLSGVRRSLAI